jgi:hypothetical protein
VIRGGDCAECCRERSSYNNNNSKQEEEAAGARGSGSITLPSHPLYGTKTILFLINGSENNP